jgi:GTP-dependent phosphoenolpyruvate carboxykinase
VVMKGRVFESSICMRGREVFLSFLCLGALWSLMLHVALTAAVSVTGFVERVAR